MIKSYKLFLESRSNIESICRWHGIKNWTLNEDGSIDVDGDVSLRNKGLDRFPLKFRNVTGNFYCEGNRLTSLEGVPESVNGDFWCDNNQLTSLKGGPQSVGGGFYYHDNKLISLEGAPQSVGGDFWGDNNQLTSLEYCTENFMDISLYNNPIYEFIDLFYGGLTPDIVRYLNEYDVIQDDIIVLDRLKEVVETLRVKFNFDGLKWLKNYKVEE